ncbi:MAG: nitroreductase family protein [bacterium]
MSETKNEITANESALMEIIKERRSVRNFNPDKPVEDEKLQILLEAARLAPSSNNTQPWRFIVVKDANTREMISKAAPLGAATNKWMRHAPVTIVCCGRPDLLMHKSVGQIFDKDFFKIDVAIAVEHIALAAKELGLGTCWVGWFDERKIRSILHIPSDTRVLLLMPVGYPKGAWPAAKKRKNMDEIVSYERFGNKTPAK